MGKVIGLLLLVGGIALILLDLFVFNEPRAALKAGSVSVAVQGEQTLGVIAIVGAVCAVLGMGALFVLGRR